MTSGGGTGGSWWTVLIRVYCRVNEQLVSGDTGKKRKILKRREREFFFFGEFFLGRVSFLRVCCPEVILYFALSQCCPIRLLRFLICVYSVLLTRHAR